MSGICDSSPKNPPEKRDTTERDAHFKLYEEYAKSIRTWFVAYGIGGPVLFLNNEKARLIMAESAYGRWIGYTFLACVFLQVALALVNKFIMWCQYYGEESGEFKNSNSYKWSKANCDEIRIDLLVDGITVVLYVVATCVAFEILFASTGPKIVPQVDI